MPLADAQKTTEALNRVGKQADMAVVGLIALIEKLRAADVLSVEAVQEIADVMSQMLPMGDERRLEGALSSVLPGYRTPRSRVFDEMRRRQESQEDQAES